MIASYLIPLMVGTAVTPALDGDWKLGYFGHVAQIVGGRWLAIVLVMSAAVAQVRASTRVPPQHQNPSRTSKHAPTTLLCFAHTHEATPPPHARRWACSPTRRTRAGGHV